MVCEPIRIGTIENNAKNQDFDSQQYRVYSPEGKSVTICGQGGGVGAKTDLYAINIKFLSEKEMEYMLRETSDGRNHFDFKHHSSTTDDKSACVVSNFSKGVPYNVLCESVDEDGNYLFDGKLIYTVKGKKIIYKGSEHNINLPDGHYIIRKLTVKECERLQTMPDGYVDGIVSDTQAYKCLGNGWTAEVIIHLLSYGLKDVPKDYPIEVLSMYDGIATGRYCLDKLGYTNITYKSYEIDEYAKKVAMKNYPDIIQCGDAFDLRNDNWKY
jgi:DNA (cytosine-5)-methyltransferase 3A